MGPVPDKSISHPMNTALLAIYRAIVGATFTAPMAPNRVQTMGTRSYYIVNIHSTSIKFVGARFIAPWSWINVDRSRGEHDPQRIDNLPKQKKKVRKKNMKDLTRSVINEHDNNVKTWYPARETSGTMMKLLQIIIAYEGDDDDEDPDNYWHP